MITQNMKNIMACMLQASANVYGMLPVTATNGIQMFIAPNFSFPDSRNESFSSDALAAGISFGRGNTPATERDYVLEDTITSGITVTITGNEVGMDNGCPYHKYTFTVVNNTGTELIIKEVGYKQSISACIVSGYTTSTSARVLIDRTVLTTPLTIQNGDAGVLVYTLKTIPSN